MNCVVGPGVVAQARAVKGLQCQPGVSAFLMRKGNFGDWQPRKLPAGPLPTSMTPSHALVWAAIIFGGLIPGALSLVPGSWWPFRQ